MSNYKIISDSDAFNDFISWLPAVKESEQFYCCLFSRKKYCPEVAWTTTDKTQMRRFTAAPERLYDKTRQLEVPLGSFTSKGKEIPQEALAFYVNPNPRDLWKATLRGFSALAAKIENNDRGVNPHQVMLTTIHNSPGTKHFAIFDIDEKAPELYEKAVDMCDGLCDVIETRGGYHVLVHLQRAKEIKNKRWYQNLAEISDVTGDALVPAVGCFQGGFVPKFLRKLHHERI